MIEAILKILKSMKDYGDVKKIINKKAKEVFENDELFADLSVEEKEKLVRYYIFEMFLEASDNIERAEEMFKLYENYENIPKKEQEKLDNTIILYKEINGLNEEQVNDFQ